MTNNAVADVGRKGKHVAVAGRQSSVAHHRQSGAMRHDTLDMSNALSQVKGASYPEPTGDTQFYNEALPSFVLVCIQSLAEVSITQLNTFIPPHQEVVGIRVPVRV